MGIEYLEELVSKKRIIWAASVYVRHERESQPRARNILRQALGEEVELRWLTGGSEPGEGAVETAEFEEQGS